jgi:Protein of unknown function (DUF3379)
MNCLESRRALLADPRCRADAVEEHVASCEACTRLTDELARLDRDIAAAASIRPPDALADRILLNRRHTPLRQYAVAAALVIGSAVAVIAGSQLTERFFSPTSLQAVGPAHPAIAAITEVLDDAFRPVQADAQGSRDVDQVLKRLGLTVNKSEVTAAHYVGKCYVTASDCDHIVLSTRDAQANVMVVLDQPLGDRVIVADRHMSALVQPAGKGGYIVVAETPKKARRIERLLVKG